ncbi:MAG: efflux RND transporter periplasmic adaptor subunit [Polyangiaceae bacterium]|nr:efflux RND transporter periplasmic adaptor subunit [Polyangiaceae bacterium]
MKSKKKLWLRLLVLVVVLGGLGVGGYFLWTKVIKKTSAQATGQPVTVSRGDLVEMASASGTIQPHVQVDVKSRAGGQVVEILTEEGRTVEAGELLAKIDPADAQRDLDVARIQLRKLQADLEAAYAGVSAADLDLKQAQANQAVSNRGLGLGLVSAEADRNTNFTAAVGATTLRQKRAQVASLMTQLESAKLNVADAERQLTYTSIFAPMSGTVLAVQTVVGSMVSSALTNVSGGTTLMTVADLSDLRVIGQIDQAQISRVSVGFEVFIRVDAYPERSFEGKVARVSPLGKTVSNVVTFDVEIVITDKDAALLRSGMSADVQIVTARHTGVVLVPLLAIQSRGPARLVTLPSGEQRRIKTGATDGTQIVVLEGLEEGDTVLIVAPTASPARTTQGGGMPMGVPGGGAPRGGGRL